MYLTSRELAAEIGCSVSTIERHARKMEASGEWPGIRSRVGYPRRINREMFLRYTYGPAWREEDERTGHNTATFNAI